MTRAAVVLAAGKGTRFRSDRPKVLHHVAGRSVLRWVLEALRPLGLDTVAVVVGHGADAVRDEAAAADLPGLVTVYQAEQRGTGHAARVALADDALRDADTVLVLPGDVPLLRSAPLADLLERHTPPMTLLTARLQDPTGYGRVLRDADGRPARVVEERDATDAERDVTEVAVSVYAFDRAALDDALSGLSTRNAQGEEYLTDAVAALAPLGVATVAADARDVVGVNDRWQLAQAGVVLRERRVADLARGGVTVEDPATTWVGPDVVVEPDALLRPGVHLEGATMVAAGCVVGPDTRLVDTVVEAGAVVAYSVLVGARVGRDADVGPFTYLRPGTELGPSSKAGAFVEMKASTVGAGSKVPHLSYVGDATIGEGANVGAGTVTVNYDGFAKHGTVIGDGARIGSDTMLVAPVTIGAGAFTGAGSVITSDVPDGALAVERSQQRTIEGYAARARTRKARDQEQ